MLTLAGVEKIYTTREGGRLVALEPVSFTFAQGEFLSLIGPSGSGKSTLLHLIAGLEPPSRGEILLRGQRVVGPSRERGIVFQNYTLFPWLTVEENVRFSQQLAANRNLRDSGYAQHLLEVIGLAKFTRAYPRELSGGMKQRAAIARALVSRPQLLLMDEPFGALDAQTREDMQELILLLSRREGVSVLFVTHDIEEAIYLGDRVLVLSAHPGHLVHETRVPFGRDRALDIKLDPNFLALKRNLTHLLHSRPSFDRSRLRSEISSEQP
jgi:ABC-type nitrate/sulfonate/bicarbonate transport system ATPase subunit